MYQASIANSISTLIFGNEGKILSDGNKINLNNELHGSDKITISRTQRAVTNKIVNLIHEYLDWELVEYKFEKFNLRKNYHLIYLIRIIRYLLKKKFGLMK